MLCCVVKTWSSGVSSDALRETVCVCQLPQSRVGCHGSQEAAGLHHCRLHSPAPLSRQCCEGGASYSAEVRVGVCSSAVSIFIVTTLIITTHHYYSTIITTLSSSPLSPSQLVSSQLPLSQLSLSINPSPNPTILTLHLLSLLPSLFLLPPHPDPGQRGLFPLPVWRSATSGAQAAARTGTSVATFTCQRARVWMPQEASEHAHGQWTPVIHYHQQQLCILSALNSVSYTMCRVYLVTG